jgi:branched-chain amino acid transport system ATP-binding protein
VSLLEIENLSTAYGAITVNRQVSLTVDEQEVVTIIGPNGAGKSTLLRVIAGLKRPTSGSVRLAGLDVTGHPADRMARAGLVLVPEGRRIFPAITVRDNLRLGGYARYDPRGVERDIAEMEAFFPILAEKRHARGADLSGGQQQMLAIARGLMARPRILLLDEPSLGLAPIMVKEVRAIIGAVQGKFGTTILLVEQNASLALSVADRGYIMQTGRIVGAGTIAELRASSLMREAYLGERSRDAGAAAAPR